MCYQNGALYLHCSHVVLASLQNCTQANQKCANYAGPTIHSYLLCCPACRGRFKHTIYGNPKTSDSGNCTVQNTTLSTLPTCAWIELRANPAITMTHTTQSQSATSSAFPYDIGLSSAYAPLQINPFQPAAAPTTASSSLPNTEYTLTSLRFPLTKCHHLYSFNMPVTHIDDSGDNALPCGCWTGKAPNSQTVQATSFVQYVGAETNFSSVWDVTGLGQIGCWKCGELEKDKAGNYVGNIVEPAGNTGPADGQIQAKKERKFMEECRRWQKVEDWKDKHMDGDIGEREAQLMVASRW